MCSAKLPQCRQRKAEEEEKDDDLQQPVRFLHLGVQLRNLLLQCSNLPKQGHKVSKRNNEEQNHLEHSVVDDVGDDSR